MKKIFILTLILTLALVGCTTTDETGALEASGVIEASELNLAPELGGRVVELSADEGASVSVGAILLRLDDSLLLAERASVESTLATVRANITAADVAVETAELAYKQTLSAAIAAEAIIRTELWEESKPGEFDLPMWYFDKEERISAMQAEMDAALEALEKKQDKLTETSEKAGSKDFLQVEAALAEALAARRAQSHPSRNESAAHPHGRHYDPRRRGDRAERR